jgi:hypothetical protein
VFKNLIQKLKAKEIISLYLLILGIFAFLYSPRVNVFAAFRPKFISVSSFLRPGENISANLIYDDDDDSFVGLTDCSYFASGGFQRGEFIFDPNCNGVFLANGPGGQVFSKGDTIDPNRDYTPKKLVFEDFYASQTSSYRVYQCSATQVCVQNPTGGNYVVVNRACNGNVDCYEDVISNLDQDQNDSLNGIPASNTSNVDPETVNVLETAKNRAETLEADGSVCTPIISSNGGVLFQCTKDGSPIGPNG